MGRAGRAPKLARAESAKPAEGLSLLSFYSRVHTPGLLVAHRDEPPKQDSSPRCEGGACTRSTDPASCSLNGERWRGDWQVQELDDCRDQRSTTAQDRAGLDAEATGAGKDEPVALVAEGQEWETSSRCAVHPRKQNMPEWRAWWAQPELAGDRNPSGEGWTTDATQQLRPVRSKAHASATGEGLHDSLTGNLPWGPREAALHCARPQAAAAPPLSDTPAKAALRGAAGLQRGLSRDAASGEACDHVLEKHCSSTQGNGGAGKVMASEWGAWAEPTAADAGHPATGAGGGCGLRALTDEAIDTSRNHASKGGASSSRRGLGKGSPGLQALGLDGGREEKTEDKACGDEEHSLRGEGDAGGGGWEQEEVGVGYAWERWDDGEDVDEWAEWEDKEGPPAEGLGEEQGAEAESFETADADGWAEEPPVDDYNEWDPAPCDVDATPARCHPPGGAHLPQGWAEEPLAEDFDELDSGQRESDPTRLLPAGRWQREGAEPVKGQQDELSLQGGSPPRGEPEAGNWSIGSKDAGLDLQRYARAAAAGEAGTGKTRTGETRTGDREREGAGKWGKRRRGNDQGQQASRPGAPPPGGSSRESSLAAGTPRSQVQASISRFFASSTSCQANGKGATTVSTAVFESRVRVPGSTGSGAEWLLAPEQSTGSGAEAGPGEAKRLRGDANRARGNEVPQGRTQDRPRSRWGSDGSRRCPMYKRIAGTRIAVDAFSYGAVEGVDTYCLSHFHSDHYGGLSRRWDHGPIFCSPVTAALTAMCLGVDSLWLRPVDWSTPVRLKGGVRLTLLPANHCPGAALLHFVLPCGTTVLHTGDFRASREMHEYPQLARLHVDRLYLDTTYCNPRYVFPSQAHVIERVAAFCLQLQREKARERRTLQGLQGKEGPQPGEKPRLEAQGRGADGGGGAGASAGAGGKWWEASRRALSAPPLFAVGSYSIGKERFYLGLAEALGVPIYVEPRRLRVLRALDWPELASRLTTDPTATPVHVLPLGHIRPPRLHQYLLKLGPHFGEAVGFRPTGWTFSDRFADGDVQGGLKHLQPQRHGRASVYGIPYSEHSSFAELREFVRFLRPREIIPTVNVGSNQKMQGIFADWLAS